MTAIAGGVPDVAEMGTTWTPEFADQGAFVEVAKPPAGEYVSSLIDAATSTARSGQALVRGLAGADLPQGRARKAGVEPPTTWDEMKTAAAGAIKSKVPPDIFPVGTPA